MRTRADVDREINSEKQALAQQSRNFVNVTGTRTEIITSSTGVNHAPRRNTFGHHVRRLDWRVTVCGQLADRGWSQRRQYGYVECRNCIRMLEERVG